MGKTELTQVDLEGQAYEVVNAFHPNVVHLQFQMEECHKMLTDQIDWANPEGDQVRIDISRPLPLNGPPGKLGDSDVHTLEDPTLILETLSRRFFLRLNLPDHRSVLTGSGGSSKDGDGDTSYEHAGPDVTTQDGERPQVDDQRLDLADDLKEAQDHISRTIRCILGFEIRRIDPCTIDLAIREIDDMVYSEKDVC
ncbi:hypothetical protein Tco_1468322 [Tanacetum coccineum]